MRWIALLALLAAAALLLGWWHVRSTDETVEIIIEIEDAAADTRQALEKGRRVIDDVRGERRKPANPPDTSSATADTEAPTPEP